MQINNNLTNKLNPINRYWKNNNRPMKMLFDW